MYLEKHIDLPVTNDRIKLCPIISQKKMFKIITLPMRFEITVITICIAISKFRDLIFVELNQYQYK